MGSGAAGAIERWGSDKRAAARQEARPSVRTTNRGGNAWIPE